MKKYLLSSLILLIIIFVWWYWQKKDQPITVDLPTPVDYQNFIKDTSSEEVIGVSPTDNENEAVRPTKPEQQSIKPVPANNINLAVPFTSQAPTGNWAQPWQDACEEASVLMVDYYYQNKQFPAPVEVDKILFDMVDWQIKNWGSHEDLSVADIGKYAEENFDYTSKIIDNLTPMVLIEYLLKGQPVIVPADGRILDNPYFSGEGPDYHMLVVKGYVNDVLHPGDLQAIKFITNDPGTRRGADYVYTSENLFDAIADHVDGQGATGQARGLVLIPN